jgi:hypothetical protein
MARVRPRSEEIRRFILEKVQDKSHSISKLAMDRFSISRQAANAHLRRLVHEGALTETGQTKGRVYSLAALVQWRRAYPILDGPPEDVVWRNDIRDVLNHLPQNVLDIWVYSFTEMFNNARDHSRGTEIIVDIARSAVTTEIMIADNGIGIFRKIQKEMNLLDERHAIFELSKGKLTTDPQNHTGQGIFFTSRLVDYFRILSGGVFFAHDFGDEQDWLLEQKNPHNGTAVFMKLGYHTARTPMKIFNQYTGGDEDLGFNKTVVPVMLAQYGNDQLVSRSQAKRVLARVELFKTVMLDFKNVPAIGQGFADEIFRIFVRDHPHIQLFSTHANSEVKRMIMRAQSDAATASATPIPGPNVSPSVGVDENAEDETTD